MDEQERAKIQARVQQIADMNSWDYTRMKLDYILERLMREQLGDEEPNWYPNTWTVTSMLNLPGIGRRLNREKKNESD